MDDSSRRRLEMYLAVKNVCNAKPWVWRGSAEFTEVFTDFCGRVEHVQRLAAAADMFHSVDKGIALEMAVADTLLTTDLDALIELFRTVDAAFVSDYTAARSREIVADPSTPVTRS